MFTGCLLTLWSVFTRKGQPLGESHDVFVEYTLQEVFAQLGEDLASSLISLTSRW